MPSILIFIVLLFFLLPANATVGLSLSGSETLTITTNRIITGDIVLSGDAVLTIKDTSVVVFMADGDPRADILLSGNAKLILENATLIPWILSPDNLYLNATDNSKIEIENSTFINVLDLTGSASVVGNKARIYSSAEPLNIPETDGAFGIVQLSGNTTAEFTDSTVGSIGLFFSQNDKGVFSNLKPQQYDNFNLQRDSEVSVGFNLILKNSNVLPVKMEGPFERGWTIFADPNSKIQVSDSSLNKLVLMFFRDEAVNFKDLKLDVPVTFDFRDIHLTNTVISNQWGIFGENCNVKIEDSVGIWPWPIGTGSWELKNSRMNEFDPRKFKGDFTFTNSVWAIAGEIFEDTDVKIKGTVKFTEGIDKNLRVSDSQITREYPIEITSRKKKKKAELLSISVFDGSKLIAQTKTSDKETTVELTFDQENFKKSYKMKVTSNKKTKTVPISLFTDTPIVVRF